jgi:hypothetical protein
MIRRRSCIRTPVSVDGRVYSCIRVQFGQSRIQAPQRRECRVGGVRWRRAGGGRGDAGEGRGRTLQGGFGWRGQRRQVRGESEGSARCTIYLCLRRPHPLRPASPCLCPRRRSPHPRRPLPLPPDQPRRLPLPLHQGQLTPQNVDFRTQRPRCRRQPRLLFLPGTREEQL